jgi:hypothetical protein
LILDFDGTDDRVPGRQAGTHFHGYYGDYGFLPLYGFCGRATAATPATRGRS